MEYHISAHLYKEVPDRRPSFLWFLHSTVIWHTVPLSSFYLVPLFSFLFCIKPIMDRREIKGLHCPLSWAHTHAERERTRAPPGSRNNKSKSEIHSSFLQRSKALSKAESLAAPWKIYKSRGEEGKKISVATRLQFSASPLYEFPRVFILVTMWKIKTAKRNSDEEKI